MIVLLAMLVAVMTAPGVHAAELTGKVVDTSGAALPNAVVFVQTMPPGAPTPPADPKATLDQINKEFVPHVLPVMVGTEVTFPNHDQIHHHVYSFSRAKTFEIPLYKGEPKPPVRFDQPGAVKLGCNIHDWMSAVILVVPTPYFAVTDEAGAFTLRDLPDAPLTVVAWHEGAKTAPDATAQQATPGQAAPLTFTLEVEHRPRPARGRSYD